MENLYSGNEISIATANLFSIKKGIDTSSYLRINLKKATNANLSQYSWEEINSVLYAKGWSPAHLLRLLSNLKN